MRTSRRRRRSSSSKTCSRSSRPRETTPALEELGRRRRGPLSEEFDDEEEDGRRVEELRPRPPADRELRAHRPGGGDAQEQGDYPLHADPGALVRAPQGGQRHARPLAHGHRQTLAFSLPLIEKLAAEEPRGRGRPPRMLVLAPTRELAKQVAGTLEYLGKCYGLEVATFHGGVAYPPQQRALRNGIDVLVGTPGRIIDHLSEGKLDLSEVGYAVLDEADEMLNMGFKEDVETILQVRAPAPARRPRPRPPPARDATRCADAPPSAAGDAGSRVGPPPDRSLLRHAPAVGQAGGHHPRTRPTAPSPPHRPAAHPSPRFIRWRASAERSGHRRRRRPRPVRGGEHRRAPCCPDADVRVRADRRWPT